MGKDATRDEKGQEFKKNFTIPSNGRRSLFENMDLTPHFSSFSEFFLCFGGLVVLP